MKKVVKPLKNYLIIILKINKMKKETIEEAAERLYCTIPFGFGSFNPNNKFKKLDFITGAKWQQEQNGLRLKHSEALLSNCEKTLEKKIQQERSYSEEEVLELLRERTFHCKTETEFNNQKNKCVLIADEFAIEFAYWLTDSENKNVKGQISIEELLEIYKKENEL